MVTQLKKYLALTVWQYAFVAFVYAQTNYGNVIYVSATTQKQLKVAVEDLRFSLSKATKQNFSISNEVGNTGILLIQTSEAGKLTQLGNSEAAFLESDGKNYLKISALTPQGIINGVYTYLDKLGFKWYQPGDAWAIVPDLKSIALTLHEFVKPDFELRNFWGTYGTPRNPVIDKKKSVDHEWKLWAIRNRLGGDIVLKGHTGNEFLWRHVDELRQHPEYMAMVNGHRVTPGTAAKFCATNAGLQKLFVADMVHQLQSLMSKNPGRSAYVVSAEPSDGDGFCSCDVCKQNGGISEQVFLLANLAAKEFQKISPKAFVNLYAYHTHIAPPHFNVEKNVLVAVAPYKFQLYGKPTDIIEEWCAKIPNVFIRDYYALPANNMDLPVADNAQQALIQKLHYWKEKKIRGMSVESSYSIGATGIGGLLFARLAWNVNEAPDKILKDYYANCFGNAAGGVEQAQAILSNTKGDGWKQAVLLLQQKSPSFSLQPNQKTCLTYFKAYLHYLRLFQDWENADKTEVNMTSERLLKYVWGIHNTMMVHPAAITALLAKNPRSAAYVKLHWVANGKRGSGDGYTSVIPILTTEIEKLFLEDYESVK